MGRGFKKGWNDFCSSGVFPATKPGMVIANNKTKAKREIRILPGSYSIRELKRVDSYSGNEILSIAPLRLLWIGERNNTLIFKSEEIINPEVKGRRVSKFTIPCSYIRIGNRRMLGQAAVLYLKPNSRYTLYVRDLRVSGGLLGEHVKHIRTSSNATRDHRKTFLGTIWADRIIDLPHVDTRGPRRLQVKVLIDPW
jgi:hypothetical protein